MFRHLRPFPSIKLAVRYTAVRNTTILCVRKNGKVVLAGDGQVSQGSRSTKTTAVKVRLVAKEPRILAGFAGSTADALTLLERLEQKLEQHPGELMRACVELSLFWRRDKYLKDLNSTMVVADANHVFEVTGFGDILEPDARPDGNAAMAVGSGGDFALAAAMALMDQPLEADEIVKRSMKIASEICLHTNDRLSILTIPETKLADPKPEEKTTENKTADKPL